MLKIYKPKIITLNHIRKLDNISLPNSKKESNIQQKNIVQNNINSNVNIKKDYQDGEDILWI